MNEVTVLQKLLLPSDKDWDIVGVEIQESESIIIVDVSYNKSFVLHESKECPIYDYRASRLWRHLDLWQYKTYLRARIPRYSIQEKVVSLEVSWADAKERITELLEKKR